MTDEVISVCDSDLDGHWSESSSVNLKDLNRTSYAIAGLVINTLVFIQIIVGAVILFVGM